jgi:transcription antitermination protein NusB
MSGKQRRPDGIDPQARSRARRRALQALYGWQLNGRPVPQLLEEFRHEQDMEVADLDYFEDLLTGAIGSLGQIDAVLSRHLDREIEQVDPIERAVLRLAGYELMCRLDVPYRVVINEAIESTKRFGADHGHTYVNGVLDKAAVEWRAAEVQASRRG